MTANSKGKAMSHVLTVVVSALDNVPPRGYRRARANAAAAFRRGGDCGVFTECWSPLTRLGIRSAAKASGRRIAFHGCGMKQSTLLWWDTSRVNIARDERGRILARWFLLHGVVAGRFGLVSDGRRAPYVRLVTRGGDRFWLVGIHPSPSATRKGAAAVAASRRAHRTALAAVERFLQGRKGSPVIFAGDFNHRGKWIPAADSAPGSKDIVHIEIVPNGHVVGHKSGVRFELPASDHRGFTTAIRIADHEDAR